MIDIKEVARQMRENAVKNENGCVVCSPELWEELASIIESAIMPPDEVGEQPPKQYETCKLYDPAKDKCYACFEMYCKSGNCKYYIDKAHKGWGDK